MSNKIQNISFRIAKKDDCELILEFIKGIAKYEKLLHEVVTTPRDLEIALFERKIGKVVFLVKENKEIGFALYFYNFSTFTGKCGIHLEDFFIYEEYRHLGYGKLLFKEVIKVAKSEGCPRVEWTCLKWNEPSIKFYESIGAKYMEEWMIFRLTSDSYDYALNK